MVLKKIKKEKDKKKDYLTILLEDVQGGIKLIAEGHSVLERKIDSLDIRMIRMEVDISVLKSGVADLKSGQSQSIDYLARIEDELLALRKELEENYEKKGWDKNWRKQIEEKLERIEGALEQKSFSGGIVRDGK